MIQIDFLHLPWFEINLYFVISLCIFLIVLKIMQYIGRWGNAPAENLEYASKSINIDEEPLCYQSIRKKAVPFALKKVLLFTPLFGSPKRFNFFASALAQDNYEVILIQSNKVLKKKISLHKIIEAFDPHGLIGFDLISDGFLPPKYTESNKIKMIFIRPITDNTELNLFHQIPFTYRWTYLLVLKTFFHSVHPPKTENITGNTLYIYPSKPLSLKILSQNKKKHGNSIIKIQGGGYFFYKHETLVFAAVLDFLSHPL